VTERGTGDPPPRRGTRHRGRPFVCHGPPRSQEPSRRSNGSDAGRHRWHPSDV